MGIRFKNTTHSHPVLRTSKHFQRVPVLLHSKMWFREFMARFLPSVHSVVVILSPPRHRPAWTQNHKWTRRNTYVFDTMVMFYVQLSC